MNLTLSGVLGPLCLGGFFSLAGVASADHFFSDGVAAGDVTARAAMLWTRADEPGSIRAQTATDAAFTQNVATYEAMATPEADNTVGLEVAGLSPATTYYYRFWRDDDPAAISRTGYFKTAPEFEPAAFRFLFTGDSNFAFRPLTAAGHALQEQADLLIWFGDTMYGDVPAGELGVARTLDEYRGKYRQIRSDPYMRDLLAGLAIRTGWDDHEVRNDYAGLDRNLAVEQKLAAYQAFFEYMAIRPQGEPADPFRTYRRFRYGPTVEFFMLDARQYREAGAAQACGNNPDPDGFVLAGLTRNSNCQAILREPRQMLGAEQFEWLKQSLLASSAATKFVINNVPMTHISLLPYDRWDGYDAQRRELLELIDANAITGVVFLTTDTHANAYNPDVTAYFRRHRPDYRLDNGIVIPEIIAGPLGTETLRDELLEFAGGVLGLPDSSITQLFITLQERQLVARLRDLNRLAFIDDDRVGYAVIDVEANGAWKATFRGLRSEEARNPQAQIETLYATDEGSQPSGLPCCWPVLMLMLGMLLVHNRGATRTGGL